MHSAALMHCSLRPCHSGWAQSEAATVCDKIAKAHFDNAMAKMRKSVSPADVKKFERFREQQKANKG